MRKSQSSEVSAPVSLRTASDTKLALTPMQQPEAKKFTLQDERRTELLGRQKRADDIRPYGQGAERAL